MNRFLLTTTAAIALFAGATVASAQTGAPSTASPAPSATPSVPPGGSMDSGPSGGGMQAPASREPRNSAQTPRRTQEGQRHDATPNRNAQGNQHERRGQARENSRENSRESQRNGRTHSETTGSAPASRAEITGDQRTRIVEHKSAFRAGRLDTVPFAVTVGTAVPRSVTLHAIPPTIVEVVPGWRSYRYVMVRDEILIIDPATMRIVAVVDA